MPNKTCNKSSPKASNPDYVCNPKTGRWIKASGVTAKKLGVKKPIVAKKQGSLQSKQYVTRSAAPDFRYISIDFDTKNPDERKYIDQTISQYAIICKSTTSTPMLKRVDLFSSKLTKTTGTVVPLAFEPLRRLLPEHDTIYKESKRVLVVCVDKTDDVVGFLGGTVDVLPVLDKYANDPRMDSYDRVKYINVYSEFGPQEETEPDIPLSWVEILCISPSSRGKNLSNKLITLFVDYCKSITGEKEVILGVDVAGTKENGINLGLVKNYEKLGFKFDMSWNLSDVYTMFLGAQFGAQRK